MSALEALPAGSPEALRLVRRHRGRLPSGVMIYQGRHHEAAAYPQLRAWLNVLEAANRRPRTREGYERTCAKLLLKHLGKEFGDFTEDDLLEEIMDVPPLSRHLVRVPLARWFTWGYKTRKIPVNPAEFLPDIRYRPNRDIKVFTPVEIAALRALPFPDGRLMTVLFETGIRNQEARCLTVKRVDFGEQQLLVKEGAKGGKNRQVPLTTAAVAAFSELIELDGLKQDDHFWASHPGGGHRTARAKPVFQATFGRWWRDCLLEAAVEYRKPHTTRHTFATFWLDSPLDEGEVQDMLGHESIRTTRDIYQHRHIGRTGDKMRLFERSMTESTSPDVERISATKRI